MGSIRIAVRKTNIGAPCLTRELCLKNVDWPTTVRLNLGHKAAREGAEGRALSGAVGGEARGRDQET